MGFYNTLLKMTFASEAATSEGSGCNEAGKCMPGKLVSGELTHRWGVTVMETQRRTDTVQNCPKQHSRQGPIKH